MELPDRFRLELAYADPHASNGRGKAPARFLFSLSTDLSSLGSNLSKAGSDLRGVGSKLSHALPWNRGTTP